MSQSEDDLRRVTENYERLRAENARLLRALRRESHYWYDGPRHTAKPRITVREAR